MDKEGNRDEARKLQATLRPLPPDHGLAQKPRPCDRCRRLQSLCDKQKPCQRCVKAEQTCTYEDRIIRPGRMSKHQKERFAQSGMEYVSFRERIRRKRLSKKETGTWNHYNGKERATPHEVSQETANNSNTSRYTSDGGEAALNTPAAQADDLAPLPFDVDKLIDMLIAGESDASILSTTVSSSNSASPPRPLPARAGMISVDEMPKRKAVFGAQRAAALRARKATILYERPTPLDRPPGDPAFYKFPVEMKQGSWPFHPIALDGGDSIFYFSVDGAIHESRESEYETDVKQLVKTEWSCYGPGRRITSPPWDAMREERGPPLYLWPTGNFVERDYDWLRVEAARILSNPITPILLEIYFWATEGYRCVLVPQVLPKLLASCELPPSTAPAALHARHRFQQAFYLLGCVTACVYVGSLMFSFDNTAVPVSMWRYGFDLYRIAWALCHPHKLPFGPEEISLDMLSALNVLSGYVLCHPLLSKVRIAVDFSKPELYRPVMLQTAGDEGEREVFKRILCNRLWSQNLYRIWKVKDTTFTQPFRSILMQLGPLLPWPEQYQDGGNQIGNRWSDRNFALNIELNIITEVFLDGPLSQPLTHNADLAAIARQREAAALEMFDAM